MMMMTMMMINFLNLRGVGLSMYCEMKRDLSV